MAEVASPDPSDPIIEFRGLVKRFGGVRALENVSFAVPRGEVHALVGENGAGKSTLIRICGGVFRPDGGQIRYFGRDVHFNSALESRNAGVSIVHQEVPICGHLTAAENIFLGESLPRRAGLIQWAEVNRRAGALFERLQAEIRPTDLAGSLSIAQQQIVVIAQALSINAKLVIMDEPTSALSKQEAERLFEIIRQLKAQGITVIYVSHRLEEVFSIADRITVLRDGRHIGTVPKTEAAPEPIVRMMVGREIANLFPKERHPRQAEKLLSVRGLTVPGAFEPVSFDLYGGEVLGLVGLHGSGTSQVMRAIFGQYKQASGEICVRGRKIEASSSLEAIAAGIAYVPGDRQNDGLFAAMSVVDNAGLLSLRRLAKGFGWVPIQSLLMLFLAAAETFNIKFGSVEDFVSSLSGGNQQKVVIARSLSTDPLVILLDDPTRGIDVGAKSEIHQILNRLTARGCGIIMVSSELPEVLAMSDRLIVMYKGRIRAELRHDEVDHELVMSLATGADGMARSKVTTAAQTQ
ncbi:MAG: sugar ABC transporter ATP-binding protein [Hyphomicrobiales bacterium]|nr:sugar ABC transporter ATP-binding protein [Hyphomicrobiales bacterium]